MSPLRLRSGWRAQPGEGEQDMGDDTPNTTFVETGITGSGQTNNTVAPPPPNSNLLGAPLGTSSRSTTPRFIGNYSETPDFNLASTEPPQYDDIANDGTYRRYRAQPSIERSLPSHSIDDAIEQTRPPPPPPYAEQDHQQPPASTTRNQPNAHQRSTPRRPSLVHLTTLIMQLQLKINTFPNRGNPATLLNRVRALSQEAIDLRIRAQELQLRDGIENLEDAEEKLIQMEQDLTTAVNQQTQHADNNRNNNAPPSINMRDTLLANMQSNSHAHMEHGSNRRPHTTSPPRCSTIQHDERNASDPGRPTPGQVTSDNTAITSLPPAYQRRAVQITSPTGSLTLHPSNDNLDAPQLAPTSSNNFALTGAIPRQLHHPRVQAIINSSAPQSANTTHSSLHITGVNPIPTSVERGATALPPTSRAFTESQIFHDSNRGLPRTNPRSTFNPNNRPPNGSISNHICNENARSVENALSKLQNNYRYLKNSLSQFAMKTDVIQEAQRTSSLEQTVETLQHLVTGLDSRVQQLSNNLRSATRQIEELSSQCEQLEYQCTDYESTIEQLRNQIGLTSILNHREPTVIPPQQHTVNPLHIRTFARIESRSSSSEPQDNTAEPGFQPPPLLRQNAVTIGTYNPPHTSTQHNQHNIPAPTAATNALPQRPQPSVRIPQTTTAQEAPFRRPEEGLPERQALLRQAAPPHVPNMQDNIAPMQQAAQAPLLQDAPLPNPYLHEHLAAPHAPAPMHQGIQPQAQELHAHQAPLHQLAPPHQGAQQARDTPFEASIRENSQNLIAQLDPPNLNGLAGHQLSELYRSMYTHVESERNRLDLKLQTYMDKPNAKQEVIDTATNALRLAQHWTHDLCRKYGTVDSVSTRRRPLDSLPKFQRSGGMTIWELISKLEHHTARMEEDEKLAILFDKLGSDVQDECRLLTSYNLLREYLISSYGNMTYITNSVMGDILDNPTPSGLHPRETAEFLFRLHASLCKLRQLLRIEAIPVGKVRQAIYSHSFINRIVRHLPYNVGTLFYQALQKEDIPLEEPEGQRVFELLATIIFDSYKIGAQYLTASSDNTSKQRAKGKNPANKPSVHHQEAQDNQAANTERTNRRSNGNDTRSSQRQSNLKFPCPLTPATAHKHEIPLCSDFMAMTPKERFRAICKHLCITCLQTPTQCKGKCSNEETVIAHNNICKDCLAWAQENQKKPRHTLLCGHTQHTRLTGEELTTALRSYFKDVNGINNMVINISHVDSENTSDVLASNLCAQPSFRQTSEHGGPLFNTQSGKTIYSSNCSIVPAPIDCANYITQILNIGGTEVLIMYDSGANVNLVDADLAEQLKLERTSSDRLAINTVGGQTTMVGTYCLTLGPDEENKYHAVTLHGFGHITREFKKFPLDEITNELLNSNCDVSPSETFPAYTGGSRAKILLGISSVALMPRLMGILPSGIAIYRAALTDKWGSSIIYAGPHKIFSSRMDAMHTGAYFINTEDSTNIPGLDFSSRIDTPIKDSLLSVDIIEDIEFNYDPLDIISDDLAERQLVCTATHHANCTQHCELDALKAKKVSAAQRKIFIDLTDCNKEPDFRCDTCQACPCRYQPPVKRVKSIQEQYEQKKIDESVTIEDGITKVTLPFLQNPIEAFKKKFRGANSNLHQAQRVLQTQTKKSAKIRAGLVEVFKELIDKGFVQKLSALPEEQQHIVNSSPFQHFFVWKGVEKADSISTPVRLVVDATQSGLNQLLCKGNSNLNKLREVLLAARFEKHLLTIDLQKMYNSMLLQPDAYPFSLLLFSETLSPGEEPDIYVLITAWYGTTCAGAQAAVSITKLAHAHKDEFPAAFTPLCKSRYVDDIISGANSEEELAIKASHITQTLARGGFQTKYIITSGKAPEPGASKDGQTVGMLGYRYSPAPDLIGFAINKQDQPTDNSTAPAHLTRRMITSLIGKFFDPMGLLEGYRLQLKIDSLVLTQYDWDTELPEHVARIWRERYKQIQSISTVQMPRSVVPDNCTNSKHVRITIFADGGQMAAGAVAYASYLLPDGTFSSQLITAKSKLSALTVPRNELMALRLAADIAAEIKTALPDHTLQFLFITDSVIALSWVINTSKPLRLYVLNRVSEIRNTVIGVTGCQPDDLPLFHVEGNSNPADILTKPYNIIPSDLNNGSQWTTGPSWLCNPVEEMPLKTYKDFALSKEEQAQLEEEYFPPLMFPTDVLAVDDSDADLNFATKGPSINTTAYKSPHLINPIYFGWKRAVSITSRLISFIHIKRHASHKSILIDNCAPCDELKLASDKEHYIPDPLALSKSFTKLAKHVFYREETARLRSILPSKELKKFLYKDEILWSRTRFSSEIDIEVKDIEHSPFFDSQNYPALLPVVAAKSELFFSLAIHVHNHMRPHSGVDSTLSIILTEFYPLGRPRRVLAKINDDCSQCRIIKKKTLELRLAEHPSARLTLSPPFYAIMADIAYGFKFSVFLNARKSLKGYALVIVCIFSGATNILALEALSTQCVVMAIERHAYRYGAPAVCWVDSGTQLTSLQSATFSLRACQQTVKDKFNMEIRTAAPKNHRAQGRVERKIRTLREMLERLPATKQVANSSLQWETIFSRIASMINDLPSCTTSSTQDLASTIICPNRLLLGRNNFRSLEGQIDLNNALLPSNLLQKNREICEEWLKIFAASIHRLIPRPSKWIEDEPVTTGTIVLFTHDDNPVSPSWKVGKVVTVISRSRVLIQYVKSASADGKIAKLATMERCTLNISKIFSETELALNTRSYFQQLLES